MDATDTAVIVDIAQDAQAALDTAIEAEEQAEEATQVAEEAAAQVDELEDRSEDWTQQMNRRIADLEAQHQEQVSSLRQQIADLETRVPSEPPADDPLPSSEEALPDQSEIAVIAVPEEKKKDTRPNSLRKKTLFRR